jgi:hypothetical protein
LFRFPVTTAVDRLIWKELGSLNTEQAHIKFVNALRDICEAFELFIEAHQREREDRIAVERQKVEEERSRQEEEERRRLEEEQRLERQAEKEQQVREQQK